MEEAKPRAASLVDLCDTKFFESKSHSSNFTGLTPFQLVHRYHFDRLDSRGDIKMKPGPSPPRQAASNAIG
jgi:hypothetical protein